MPRCLLDGATPGNKHPLRYQLTTLNVGIRVVFMVAASSSLPVRWRVAVDGGGTHTRLRLIDRDGQRLAEGRAGPSALGQGAAAAWAAIAAALADAASAAGLPTPAWSDCALGLGLSGANSPPLRDAFVAAAPAGAQLVLANDSDTALLGAHGGRPGVLVIAGTGSIGQVLRADGSRAQAGGWGWINGDEGSGAWLGLAAMRHAQRAFDGRERAGPLALALWQRARTETGLADGGEALLAWCAGAGQQRYATLAPVVFEREADDATAARLIAQAIADIEHLDRALDPEAGLPLALCGSIAERLAPRIFHGEADEARRHRLVRPQGDAMDGALLLLNPTPEATP